MKQELIKDFTLRISNANRGQLVVIKFDMFDAYIDGAIEALKSGDDASWKAEIRRAAAVLGSFKDTLDFKYELSANLYAIYHYCEKLCWKALSLRDAGKLKEASALMQKLGDAFRKAAASDTSPALMANSQQVVAGMTYGPGILNEGTNSEPNRGFLA